MKRLTQQELDRILELHRAFRKGMRGGIRARLKFADLSGLNFRGADLSNADLTGCKLNDANLSKGSFRACSFFCCDMTRTDMSDADFSRADFRGANISGANLASAKFVDADMRKGVYIDYSSENSDGGWSSTGKTTFAGTVARDTDLTGVLAQGSDFSNANLSGVVVRDANFSGANLHGANLTDADFTGSDLSYTDFDGAIMKDVKLDHTTSVKSNVEEVVSAQKSVKSLADEGLTIEGLINAHTLWIDTAGREGAQFKLQDYDLSKQTTLRDHALTAIIARGCKFSGLNLQGARMQSSFLDDADFQDCIGQQSDMRGSSCKNALFTRADFRHANFSGLKIEMADGTETFHPCNLSGSKMAFAKLDKTNFRGAILKNVDFTSASLVGCNFKDADLEGAIFDGADLTDARLEGTILENKPIGKKAQ